MIAGIAIIAMSAYQFMTRLSSGDIAPPIELSTLDGKKVSLTEFRGRPVIVHFFATWCGVCQQEFPMLNSFNEYAKKEGFVFMAISEDANKKDLETFLNFTKPSFDVLVDANGKIADSYQSFGVPETFLIDKKGVVAWRRAGAIDWASKSVRDEFLTLVR